MRSKREYPERPLVGVGGVVIANERALLIRRGSEPLKGEWSIPGGMLELGEKIADGIARELKEETGLTVLVLEFIEVFERIFPDSKEGGPPRYHFVIVDYLCEKLEGEARPGSDVTDVAWVREEELGRYGVSPSATRVLKKAFAMARERGTCAS
jgi:8-oxo-dGTP diphosphatase